MRHPAIFLGAFVLVAMVLTGCEEYGDYTPSAADLTALAKNYDGDDKEAIQATAVARYLAAENARAAKEQAQAQIAALEATKQAAAAASERQQYMIMTAQAEERERAAQATREQQWQWATIESSNATQCAQATAQAISVEMTAQAVAIQATAQQRAYEATATAEARSYEATATAQYKADVATATRQAQEARASATAESVQATAAAYAATATRAQEKREMTLAYGRDYGIPIVLLLLGAGMIIFLVYAARQYSRRPVVYPRSILGDAEPMAVPVQGGGYTFVDLDRQPGPALTVLPSGQVAAPLLRSAGQEERTTARDQLVDGMSRPKLGAGHKGGQSPQIPMAPPPTPPAPGLRSVRVLRRLDQAERAGFLPPPLVAALAADWEEEQ